ncbi:MAG: restriction endonuclease subunit S [Bacteroidales bacterium]|nr:restriction endonuclease subunit S [Bacteroidales bacterium]
MEVKKTDTLNLLKGYKQTEIGIIPEDWEVKNLGSIGNFTKGQGIRKDQSNSGYIPCVRYGEIYTKHYDYIKEFYSYISDEVALTSKKLKIGDILFAGSGETKSEIGKSIAYTKDVEAYAGGDIVILSPNKVNSLFLGFLLNDKTVQKQKASKGQGDAVVHISASQLANIQIPLPPLPEQKAIAQVLSDTDKLIQALEKLIAKKRKIKQGAMQKLLTPKEGWELRTLGNCLFDRPTYGINAAAVSYNLNLPTYLRITDISEDGNFIYENKASVDATNSNDFYLKENEIVFARTGASVGKTYLYNKNDGLLVYAGFLIKVSPNPKKLNSKYLKYFTQSTKYWNWVKIMSMRSGQPGINGNEYAQLKIPLPTLNEQTLIAQILSDMDLEIEALEKKTTKYRQIKQGMMQVLLTGKIRLL